MDIDGFKERYQGLAPLSMRAYELTLSQLQRFIGGEEEPTDEQVRLFLQNFQNASYVQRHKAAIKRYYTYTKRVWPFDPMEFSRPRTRVPRGSKPEVIMRILDFAADTNEYMFIKTTYLLGARCAEVRGITKDCIGEEGVRLLGKGDKERIVPVTDEKFMEELEDYAHQFGQEAPMFPGSYHFYRDILTRCCEDAGVPVLTLHQLRHTRAIELVNKGLKLNELQQFLGHENPATTMQYLRVGSGEVLSSMKQIGA